MVPACVSPTLGVLGPMSTSVPSAETKADGTGGVNTSVTFISCDSGAAAGAAAAACMLTVNSVNVSQASTDDACTSALRWLLMTHPSRGARVLTTGLFGCIHMAQSSMSESISIAALPRPVGKRHKVTHKRGLLGRWVGQRSGQLVQGALHPGPPLRCRLGPGCRGPHMRNPLNRPRPWRCLQGWGSCRGARLALREYSHVCCATAFPESRVNRCRCMLTWRGLIRTKAVLVRSMACLHAPQVQEMVQGRSPAGCLHGFCARGPGMLKQCQLWSQADRQNPAALCAQSWRSSLQAL